ncbi:hypothetical protein L9F63_001354, partial [Diploptera punctata]
IILINMTVFWLFLNQLLNFQTGISYYKLWFSVISKSTSQFVGIFRTFLRREKSPRTISILYSISCHILSNIPLVLLQLCEGHGSGRSPIREHVVESTTDHIIWVWTNYNLFSIFLLYCFVNSLFIILYVNYNDFYLIAQTLLPPNGSLKAAFIILWKFLMLLGMMHLTARLWPVQR